MTFSNYSSLSETVGKNPAFTTISLIKTLQAEKEELADFFTYFIAFISLCDIETFSAAVIYFDFEGDKEIV